MTNKRASDGLLHMQGDWERRASTNPMYHIDSRRLDWNVDEFYAGGEAIVASAIDPVIARFGVEPAGTSVLEIGPGMGRLFPALSARFGTVVGVEISATMIELGRQHCPVRETAHWIVGDGASLTNVPDASIDYVISFEVFQHIPAYEPIRAYIAETPTSPQTRRHLSDSASTGKRPAWSVGVSASSSKPATPCRGRTQEDS